MVRTVMYIFLIFVVMWNINATFHVFAIDPNLEDPGSEFYCHPTVYHFSYVLVIIFDAFAGVGFLVWSAAIFAGKEFLSYMITGWIAEICIFRK